MTSFFFQHPNKSKATIFAKHVTETSLQNIIIFEIIRFHYFILDTPEEGCQVLVFVNPVLGLDDEMIIFLNQKEVFLIFLQFCEAVVCKKR